MTGNRFAPLALVAAVSLVAGAALAEETASCPQPAGMTFESFDLDGDGRITRAEFDQRHGARFAEADADASGALDAAELQAMMAARMQARMADRAAQMIARFDADGNGVLSIGELPWSQRAGAMFERLDADGDGAASAAEFAAAAEGMAQRKGDMRHHKHRQGAHHGAGRAGGMGRSCADQI